MKIKNIIFKGFAVSAIVLIAACSDDYLETSPTRYPEEEAIIDETQKNPELVKAYVNGALFNMYDGGDFRTGHDDFGIPAIKLATDMFCDDIAYNRDAHFFCYDYQLDNRIGNYRRVRSAWNQLYTIIDNANSIVTMLKPTEGEELTSKSAKVMIGQAYALRAYCYFWLVNLWQHRYSGGIDELGVPLKTEDEYRQERVSVGEVYDQILSDIKLGYEYLEGQGFHNGKVGLSEYAAAAIYANVLMFTGDYANAAKYAEAAAKAAPLNSEDEMLSGFNSLNMSEVLWGYNVNNETTGYYASFFSHVDTYMIGYGGKVGYRKLISSELYDKIADNDIRKKWFGYNAANNILEVSYSYEETAGLTKYLQNKFRDVYITSGGNADAFTSSIIYFRSGEMYFVAAEAYYLAGNEPKAKEMLNKVMATRISGYSYAGSGSALYDEICLQKRIDTWMEGNRYLDAKRRNETIDRSKSTNHAADLASFKAITFTMDDYRMIYRIPNTEMENNPAISSNEDNK